MAKARKKNTKKAKSVNRRVTRQKSKKTDNNLKASLSKLKDHPNPSKEFENCRQWLLAQKKLKTKLIPNDDIDDELPGTSYQPIGSIETLDTEQKNSKTKDSKATNNIIYKINAACEWAKCSEKLQDYTDLQVHVSDHINAINKCDEIDDYQYECLWDLCSYSTNNYTFFRVHIHYHVYHTNLKINGETLLMKKKLPPCLIDSRRRNFIPEIYHDSYLCQWYGCNRKYEEIYLYFAHVREHCHFDWSMEIKYKKNISNERQMNCRWVACTKTFSKLPQYIEHVQNHTQEKWFACPNCGSSFKSYNKFYKHYQRQSENKPYQCSQCFKYYATEELLCTHKNSHVNCHKCTLCDMTCPSQSSLSKHIRYRHITEKPFKCTSCSYSAKCKYDLDRHIMMKHEKTTHECEEFGCSFRTESFTLMRKHDQNVHGLGPNIYCCHCCDKTFQQGRLLSNHLIKKHNLQLPSGHSRFIYHQQIDGTYRLQTMRMESLEVTQQIMKPNDTDLSTLSTDSLQPHNVELAIAAISKIDDDNGIAIQLEMHVDAKNEFFDGSDDDDDDEDDYDDDDDEEEDDVGKSDNEILEKYNKKLMANEMPDVSESLDFIDGDTIKNIDNFTVMKRYIKPNDKIGNILIEMKEIDQHGNVTSKLINADEFRISQDNIKADIDGGGDGDDE